MSLTTVSTKRNRIYQRKFDHDEARIRHAAGESLSALAREYGVTQAAVKRIVDAEHRAAMDSRIQRWMMGGVCRDCGKQGVSRQKARCKKCASQAAATSVRPGELWCSRCQQWLPDESFPHGDKTKARRGRHQYCRQCNTAARRQYREKVKVPCERCGRPCLPPSEKGHNKSDSGLCRDCYWEGGGHKMALLKEYIVLEMNGDGHWQQHGPVMANTDAEAVLYITEGSASSGRFVAIPAAKFVIREIRAVTRYEAVKVDAKAPSTGARGSRRTPPGRQTGLDWEAPVTGHGVAGTSR